MANFDLSSLALKSVCPNNEIFVDDADLPSVMVYIPKFKNSDVLTGGNDSTHPAFIVNGQEIPGFWYSKYQNVVPPRLTDGSIAAAYSLPGEDPTASINFDSARARCEAKGAGWHLSTNAEWAAIALWCKKNGFLPYGNNNYGKDSRESNYKAIPTTFYESGQRSAGRHHGQSGNRNRPALMEPRQDSGWCLGSERQRVGMAGRNPPCVGRAPNPRKQRRSRSGQPSERNKHMLEGYQRRRRRPRGA